MARTGKPGYGAIGIFFSGDMVMAGRIGVLEVIVKLILYYSHERVWNVINWGRMPSGVDG